MAKGGGSSGKPRRPHFPKNSTSGRVSKAGAPKKTVKRAEPQPAPAPVIGEFALGAIPGATLGGWIDTWRDRMPRADLRLHPIDFATQLEQLRELDAAIVRLPIERDGLQVIPLYDEVPVIVCSADSHLTAADELDLADLAGEIVIVPQDDVLRLHVPGAAAASFSPPETTEQAIATVAAGVGIVIVPMSLARLHQRKDATYRVLRDGPVSTVALVWRTNATTPAVEAFIGIVRGRTAHSSRS